MNKDQLEAFWDEWPHDRYVVLTAISLDKRQLVTESFDQQLPQKKGEFVTWVQRHNEALQWNCYFALNPVIGPMRKKASRAEIAAMAWLHVDIDPRVREDIDKERQRALRSLQEPPNGIPKPTAIIFSGGGYQGFWRLQTPKQIKGQEAAYEDAGLAPEN